MVDLDYISKLLPILRANNIHTFKNAGLEVVFYMEQRHVETGLPPDPRLATNRIEEIPIDEAQVPADLRTDNINSYDAILNWSGSPDQGPEEMPLTGDAPLEG